MKRYNRLSTKQNWIKPEKILRLSIGVILSLIFVSGILFFFWKINLINYLPIVTLCPFHAFTGKPCPGCGMSRAFLLLGQLRIKEALEINLFSVPLFLLMIVYFSFGDIPLWMQTKNLVRISLFAILIFWVARLFNI
jgi:hypothetical protein